MESISEIYRIGTGPSSSHTMGPRKAAQLFKESVPQAVRFNVDLYGSLAATGKGHLTDKALEDVLSPAGEVTINWLADTVLDYHTNGMKFTAYDKDGNVLSDKIVFSVGGGKIVWQDEIESGESSVKSIYPMKRISDILEWCEKTGRTYWEYVDDCEGEWIWDYLHEVWEVMKAAVERGLEAEGVLPGGLGVRRKAVSYYMKASGYSSSLKSRGLVYSYALAVSEENASGGMIVTAPTCGSCGVLPAVLYHLYLSRGFSEKRILRALATAGIFGNVVKTNASISGAEVGCQGEGGGLRNGCGSCQSAVWRISCTD